MSVHAFLQRKRARGAEGAIHKKFKKNNAAGRVGKKQKA